jgi:two-component system, chemotaxis family, protein-glutamate methylesterase/glutaminase
VEKAEIRVLLVDDSPFIRRAVERMLASLEGVRVVGVAANGREGVEETQRLRPDVVILDIVMPELDGLAAIQEIMETAPTPILVLSTETSPGAEVTLRALELGAVDFVSKTQAGTRMDIYDLAPVLREKVLVVAGSRVPDAIGPPGPPQPSSPARAPEAQPPAAPAPPVPETASKVLVVGASTGGPRALAALLAAIPRNFPGGVLVAQHMPPGFTATLAQRLDRRSALTVREARDGDPIEPGVALLGVGGRQFWVDRDNGRLVARVTEADENLVHRPSVDLLFTTAASALGSAVVAVVLTGMGQDGAAGLAAIRAAGGRTLVESEESAVIFGMPRAAREWADQILPLDQLPAAILDLFEVGGA